MIQEGKNTIQRSQISTLRRQRQWDLCESEASLVYIVRACLENKN